MANNIGTLIVSPIRPQGETDVFPTVYSNEALGGHHQVANDFARDSISPSRLTDGMLVTVLSSNSNDNKMTTYQLTGGTWVNLLSNASPNLVNGILEFSGNTFRPYSATTIGSFDNSSDAPTDLTRLNYNGNLYVSALNVTGNEVEITNKNRHKVYLADDSGNTLITKQTYYWNGASFIVDNYSFGFGNSALQNNTGYNSNGFGSQSLVNNTGYNANGFGTFALRGNIGANSNGIGYYALENNTGDNSNGFGSYSLRNNKGANSNGIGFLALGNNTGDNSNGFGHLSLISNTGTQSNGFGDNSLSNNTGANSNGFGHFALLYNSGINSNGFGFQSLTSNIGDNANGFGSSALINNTGYDVNGFGSDVLQYNTGNNSVGFGSGILQKNNWNNITSIGQYSNVLFNLDLTTTKNFADTDIDIVTKNITINSHGFGTIDRYINLMFKVITGTPPGNLIDNSVFQFYIVDYNTLRYSSISSVDVGTFSLTNSINITNSTAIGYNSNNNKANQIMLGNSNITEVVSSGVLTLKDIYSLPTTAGLPGQVLSSQGPNSAFTWANSGGTGGVSASVSQNLTSSGSITWDFSLGDIANLTLDNVGATLNINNAVSGVTGMLIITQGVGGYKTITTWPTNSKFMGGTNTLSTLAGAIDILSFIYVNGFYYWNLGGGYV